MGTQGVPSAEGGPLPGHPPQRTRTRARSGGGDLPSSVTALKRAARPDYDGDGGGDAAGRSGARSAPPMAGGGGAGGGDGGGGGDSSGAGDKPWADLETGSSGTFHLTDPHKGRLRAMLETTTEGFMRMLSDPWLFIWHTHLALTFMHFITWQTTYGGVGGSGPASRSVREFDDVVVSLMGLSGWLAVIYFFRGFKPTGKLAVILERCLVDVARFVSLYVLWNIGFTLAFFTMTRGTLYVTDTPREKESTPVLAGINGSMGGENQGITSIGWGMMSLINLGLGLGLHEYRYVCDLGHEVTSVFCTIYYLAYMATSAILLLNLLTAMIIRTYNTAQEAAEAHWRRRWATYCVKAERRMPAAWVQRLRLGQPAWDPMSRQHQYSHIFEEIEEDRGRKDDRGELDSQIRAVNDLLEGLKRQRGSSAAASGSGGGGTGQAGAQ
ncbi:MAG: hypothetical protein J3K34DRAFT_32028 [Monoraphidium minutum]|nr:MAG: hypothetical protein J3K34DRAFT_32028 [Monoraphidium minutum]